MRCESGTGSWVELNKEMKIKRYVTGPIQVNTYVAYDEETRKGFIVDPGGYVPEITKAIKKAGIDLQYIILTHGHGDHIGGVADMQRDFPQAKCVACQAEQEMLNDGRLNSSLEMFGKPITVDVDCWVKDGDSLQVGGIPLTFIYTPGHTKGGMCVYTPGFLFSGDTLFRFSIGRTDFYGGDFHVLLESIRTRLFQLPDDTVVLPGHMDTTTIGEEKRGNPFV